MTVGGLDREIWLYTPTSHKTAHRGKKRTIYIGPRAQAILKPWLLRETGRSWPREGKDDRRAGVGGSLAGTVFFAPAEVRFAPVKPAEIEELRRRR